MKDLRSFNVQNKCSDCSLQNEHFFCRFDAAGLKMFESLKITNAYSKGTTLFIQGQPSNGIYMICQGRVKLTTYSRDGKAMILGIAEAGEVLGVSAAVTGSMHEATAVVIDTCQVNFVRKEDFLRMVQQHPDTGVNAIKQLSRNYQTAYTQIRSLGLSNSVGDKLAKLFLEWCRTKSNGGDRICLKIDLTHEEIAEMIGTSRETVTRLLKSFKDRDLIEINGTELLILDRARLEASIGTRPKI
jgi:CRP/FNR family transcriptional regulator